MLKVVATNDTGAVVAELEITTVDKDWCRYSVRAAVAEPEGFRYTQRNFAFPRLVGNYLGFIESALLALDDEIKDFVDAPLGTSDLAGRQHNGVPEIQAWPS